MKYKEIRILETDEYNKILKESGVFWAFDKKQFNENKTLLEGDDDKYVSIGCGGFMPKSKTKKLRERLDELDIKIENLIKKNKQEENHILYELDNHECFYTGSITEAERVLPYSQEQILNVYRNNYKERIRNL